MIDSMMKLRISQYTTQVLFTDSRVSNGSPNLMSEGEGGMVGTLRRGGISEKQNCHS